MTMTRDDDRRSEESSTTLTTTTTTNASLDFESAGGKLVPFDDGHVPETFRVSPPPPSSGEGGGGDGRRVFGGPSSSRGGREEEPPAGDDERGSGSSSSSTSTSSTTTTKALSPSLMVRYPLHESSSSPPRSSPPDLCVYDDVLPSSLTSAIYDATVNVAASTKGRPWGTYVTIDEAISYLRRTSTERVKGDDANVWRRRDGKEEEDGERRRHDLSVVAVARFLLQRVPLDPEGSGRAVAVVPAPPPHSSSSNPPTSPPSPSGLSSRPLYDLSEFRRQAHGVAVWALSSDAQTAVRYHVDYAELLRYERNVLCPPLWAGTVHCTDFDDEGGEGGGEGGGGMVGGEFAANLGGWDHYLSQGYKGAKSGDDLGGWTRPPSPSPSPSSHNNVLGGVRHDAQTSWVTIPYKTNRGIIHRGHFPHLGAPVLRLPPNKTRVIMGLNVFGYDVGHEVSKAPEHSDSFRRRVKVLRALNRSTAGRIEGGRIDVGTIRKNKAFTKLLVLAKREKVKEDWRVARSKLSQDVVSALLPPSSRSVVVADRSEEAETPTDNVAIARMTMTASELAKRFGRTDGTWPSVSDAEVHLEHMIRDEEVVEVVVTSSLPSNDEANGGSTNVENGAPRRYVVRRRRAPTPKEDDAASSSREEEDSILYLEER